MLEIIYSAAALAAVAAAMLLAWEGGRRTGRQRRAADPAGSHQGTGAVEAAVFGLMGLLLAFSFSGAAARFEARRELLLREVNAIGTAWGRLDLLPPADRDALRAEFRTYADLRLAATRAHAVQADLALKTCQGRIWSRAAAVALAAPDARVGQLLLPALNEMFDVATARYLAAATHPPAAIPALLVFLALVCSAMAGYGMAGSRARSRLHLVGFIASLLFVLYVILDLEFPRRGFLRLDSYDQAFHELRADMH